MKARIALPVHQRDVPQVNNTNSRRRVLSITLLLAFSIAGYFLCFRSGRAQDVTDFANKSHPRFKHMIQSLPSKLLPETGKHRHHGRLVIVGDVHGMKDSLVTLLAKIDFDKKHDHLILAGDMISKGPDSVGVIDLVMQLGATGIRGNHEDRVIQQYTDMVASQVIITEDGEEPYDIIEEPTLDTKNRKDRKLVKALGGKRIRWLKSCPVILRVGELGDMGNLVVVHAGLEPGVRLEKQDPNMVMNMRTIGKHGPSDEHNGKGWMKAWNKYQKSLPKEDRSTVIYGHDSKRGLRKEKYSIGIDTGCLKGGKLTAVVIEGGQSRHKHRLVHVGCNDGRQ